MSLLKFERPTIKNLGELASKIYRHNKNMAAAHDDVPLWHGPSECHDLISRWGDVHLEKIWEEIEKETGLSRDEIEKEFARRGTYKFVYFYL